jgi:hypothetical protein
MLAKSSRRTWIWMGARGFEPRGRATGKRGFDPIEDAGEASMRCVEVIRELAARAGGPASAGMTEHLASCPRCARWAERDAKLERL